MSKKIEIYCHIDDFNTGEKILMILRKFYLILIFFSWTVLQVKAQYQSAADTASLPLQIKIPSTSLILPISLIALGSYSIHNTAFINRYAIRDWRNKNYPNFNTDADDYLEHLGLAAGFIVGAFGKKDKLWLYTKRVLLTEILTNTAIQFIKRQSHIRRPNESDYLSFPSGHTTEAFAGAILFNDHFARGKPLLQILSLSAATSVGVMRVMKNRHWANDVIAGAGFGILSAKLSEIVFREKKPLD